MQRERLTPERIRRFNCADGTAQAFLWDTEAPGLAVRATAGASAFVFQGKLNNKDFRMTIGDVRAWGIDDARTEARRLQTEIDQGNDPRQQKAERIAAAEAKRAAAEAAKADAERQARYTLRALCDAYLSALERAGKGKSAAGARSLFKCHIDQDTANKSARAVTAHEVAALVRRVREAGKERAAGVLRSYLSAAFNAAKRAPFDSALPADLIPFGIEHNPVDAIPAIAVQRGDRTLSAGELRAYIGHLLRIGHETGPELANPRFCWRCTRVGRAWRNCCAPRPERPSAPSRKAARPSWPACGFSRRMAAWR